MRASSDALKRRVMMTTDEFYEQCRRLQSVFVAALSQCEQAIERAARLPSGDARSRTLATARERLSDARSAMRRRLAIADVAGELVPGMLAQGRMFETNAAALEAKLFDTDPRSLS